MPIEKLRHNFSFDEEKINQLKQLIPEAFADNQINWEVLQEALGDYLEDDQQDIEHFGLFWPGKREARKMVSMSSKGTLIPISGEGIDEENTRNIFIEGENLEVLKILQKSYAGKIKMIYIDPPYNTGNDFVYADDYTEPLEEYLRRTGQIDEEGKPLTTNKKSDGRFHSKWLSMMYPRLRLARNLLRDDGVLFVSIDDNELQNLKTVLNEIFGEENFIGTFIIKSNPRGSQSTKSTAIVHEYLLVFVKDISKNFQFGLELSEKMRLEYKHENKDGLKYRLLGLRQRGGAWRRKDRPSLFFPIYIDKNTGAISVMKVPSFNIEVLPIKPTTGEEGSWRWSKEKITKNLGDIIGKKVSRDGFEEWDIYQLDYLHGSEGDEKKTKPKTIWDEKELNYQNGTTELKKLFDGVEVFSFPKPVYLLEKIIKMVELENGDYVLDFFAGSGTTGHAVLSLQNLGIDINFIVIQMKEIFAQDSNAAQRGYESISSVAIERLRRVNKTFKNHKKENDIGFKVYRLHNSNYKAWDNYMGSNINELESLFALSESSLKEKWESKNLIIEILLIEGFPLDSKIVKVADFKKNNILQITSDYCEHQILICLDKKIQTETITNLQLSNQNVFICLDNAIRDEEKAMLSDKGLIKTI